MLTTIENARSDALLHIVAGFPVYFAGAPGIGKSDLTKLLAADWELLINKPVGYVDIRASQLDAVDTRGLPVPDMANGTTKWLVPSMLPQVERDGEYGILNFDEVSNATLSVQAALYQLFLDRQLGDYTLPFGWRMVATGNRLIDRAAAQRMSTALSTRFMVIEFQADAKAWCNWARFKGIHQALIAFITFRPELIYVPPGTDQFSYPNPRSIARLHSYLTMDPVISDVQLSRVVQQSCGEAFAVEFMAFLPVFRSMPSTKAILADPLGTPVPDPRADGSLCYAIASALASVVDAGTLFAGMQYAARMGAEYRGLMIDAATARDATLMETKVYTDYCVAIARTGQAA